MELGRNFTNILNFNYLTEPEKEKFLDGKLSVEDLGAIAGERVKKNIQDQLRQAHLLGISHIELDGAVPNPFLSFTDEEILKVKSEAKKLKITLSLHLPYTFVGASISSIQEEDREISIQLHKKYLQFAFKIGCISAVIHPGGIPFYQISPIYKEMYKEALIDSLLELGDFASACKIKLHLENETVFHNFVFTPEELLEIVEIVRKKGIELYLNFDIGHWFTIMDSGFSIPENPEKIIEMFPSEFLFELHLNDYVPKDKIFHPPLHRESGFLKKENLKNYFEIVKKKGVQLIVLETAFREKQDIIKGIEIIKEEDKFIKEILWS